MPPSFRRFKLCSLTRLAEAAGSTPAGVRDAAKKMVFLVVGEAGNVLQRREVDTAEAEVTAYEFLKYIEPFSRLSRRPAYVAWRAFSQPGSSLCGGAHARTAYLRRTRRASLPKIRHRGRPHASEDAKAAPADTA
jgi:hypothetical protein